MDTAEGERIYQQVAEQRGLIDPPAIGLKYDREKLRYDLISPLALEALVEVLTYGAKKYADRNWERGISWCRVFAALMRHLWAWFRGEEFDSESGLPHLAHAMCCVMFLLHYSHTRRDFDDRPLEG